MKPAIMFPSCLRWAVATALVVLGFAIATGATTPTQLENAKPGDSSWELSNPAKNGEIEGYGSAPSLNRGENITFYVNTASSTYSLEIFRIGWYGGAGARKMLPAVVLAGFQQPLPSPDPATGLIECQWAPSFVLQVPSDASDPTNWMSGIYLVKLTTFDTQKQAYILFVVRDDSRPSDFLFQNSVATYEAYNLWGGMSLYSAPRAYKVSFNRPFKDGYGAADFATWKWENHMLRFLEREGYDVTYATDLDTHSRGASLLTHKAFLVVGHDEYWSWQMRDNVEQARDHGVSLGFFGANIGYWQVRFEPSVATGAPDRTMVCYKSATLDPISQSGNPSDQRLATTRFRSPPVSRPEDALVGVMYETASLSGDMVVMNASHWIWEGTGLQNADHLAGLLGYEVDRIFGDAPPWIELVAHSPYEAMGNVGCPGVNPPGCEVRYSDMAVYEMESGAIVVATGTMHWNRGLDRIAADPESQANTAVCQATRNILARFLHPSAHYLEPRTLTFPAQLVGTVSPSQEIVIVNHEASPLTIEEVTSGDDFRQKSTCQGSLSAGQRCVIEVSFTPHAVGVLTGILSFNLSNDPGNPIRVQLKGIGVDYSLSAGLESSDTATVYAGQVAQFHLNLVSSGFNGHVGFSCNVAPSDFECRVFPSHDVLIEDTSSEILVSVRTSGKWFEAMQQVTRQPGTRLPHGKLALICLFLFLIPAAALVSRRRSPPLFASALFFAALCTSCVGGVTAPMTADRAMPGAVSYELTINATSEGVTRSATLQLTVQSTVSHSRLPVR